MRCTCLGSQLPIGSFRIRCRLSSTTMMAPLSKSEPDSSRTQFNRSMTCSVLVSWRRNKTTLTIAAADPASISPKSRSNVKTIRFSAKLFFENIAVGQSMQPLLAQVDCVVTDLAQPFDNPHRDTHVREEFHASTLGRNDFFLSEPSRVGESLANIVRLQVRIIKQHFIP